MIGDKVVLEEGELRPAHTIYQWLKNNLSIQQKPYCIAIAGESGCGKTTLALGLEQVMEADNIKVAILHMDDYFRLPPHTNHLNREKDLANVGTQEVKLDLLESHISQIKAGLTLLEKPLSNNVDNTLTTEVLSIAGVQVVIVEGTYTSLLDTVDLKIFLDIDYKATFEARKKRARDPITPFVEQVLEIEHQIIKKHRSLADIIVDKDYSIHFSSGE